MTRPPSGEWPAGLTGANGTDGPGSPDAHDLRTIAAELTRDDRPAPARLREWIVGAADTERARSTVDLHRPGPTGRGPSPIHPIGIPRPIGPVPGNEEDTMSGMTWTATGRAALPDRSASPVRSRHADGIRRTPSLARRWNRHGWPVLELIGAAVLIVGLVSVMVGGSGGGGLPALLPGFGQTSQQATPVPSVDAGAVAMAQGNAGRTGEMPGPGVASDPAVRWQIPLDVAEEDVYVPVSDVNPGIVAVDGLMLYVDRDGLRDPGGGVYLADVTLRAVDTETGTDRWTATYTGVSQGQPLVAEGLVIVTVDPPDGLLAADPATPSPDEQADRTRGYVVAFDAMTGIERWRTAVGLVGHQDPVYASELVFVMDRNGDTHGLDVQTGRPRWSAPNVPPSGFDYLYEASSPVSSSIAVAGGMVVVTSYSGFTYAFTLDTGAVAWSWPAAVGNGLNDYGSGFQTRTIDPVIADETVFLSGNRNNGRTVFAAVDLQTGQTRWMREGQSYEPVSLAVADGIVVTIVGDHNDRVLRAIDVATGMTVLWEVPLDEPAQTLPTIADGVVYHGGPDGTVRAIDLATGSVLWQVRAGGAIASPIYAAGGAVFFASQDDWLYAVDGSGSPADDPTASIDISGLPACDVEPRPAVQATPIPDGTTELPIVTLPDATPAITLSGIDPGDQQMNEPVIGWDEIPIGTSVTGERATGIAATLQRMQSCDRPGNGRYLAAFYTDDYFLRPWVVWQVAYDGYGGFSFRGGVGGGVDQTEILATARVLPDGRVALVQTSDMNPGFGGLIVFTEQNGQWLIDETASITPDGRPRLG